MSAGWQGNRSGIERIDISAVRVAMIRLDFGAKMAGPREATIMTETLLPTTVVGSYPQPDWLIDREKLTHLPPVRVRAGELWRVPEP